MVVATRRAVALGLAAIAGTAGAWAGEAPESSGYVPREPVRGTLRLWGHGSFRRDFMGRLVQRWFGEFSRHHPAVDLDYRMYGTASAVGALYSDAGNLAVLGEEVSPDARRAFERARGYAPTVIPVATGSLDVNYFDYAHMIFVHRDNPLQRLALPELAAIFGANQQAARRGIRVWGDLGLPGEWAARPIQPYGWRVDEDFGLFFRERVLGDSHRWNEAIREFVHRTRPDGSQYDHGQQILDALATDRGGIAVSNVRYQNADVRALALSWRRGGRYVHATRESLIDQSYPLVRIIPAIVDRVPGGAIEPVVREFLRYLLSVPGQQALVEESGYLPLGPAAIAAARGQLS